MFTKSRLASAVAAAVGVSAVGIQGAQADSLFFPYVAVSNSVTTVVSVINLSYNNYTPNGQAGGNNLHYRLYYKTQDVDTAPCAEFDQFLPTSPNDLQSIDLGNHFGADTLGVLFQDPSINNNWMVANKSYAMAEAVYPIRGYLYVDNNDPAGDAETLTGEAINFDFGSGAAWGYQAYTSNGDQFVPADYHWASTRNGTNVAFMPFAEVATALLVTPVSYDQSPDFQNAFASRLEFVSGVTARGDVYDRDENLISGTVPADVVCVARVNVQDLLTAGAANRVASGGWGKLLNYRLDGEAPAIFRRDVAAVDFQPGTAELTNMMQDADGNPTGAPVTKQTADGGAVVVKLEYNVGTTLNGITTGTDIYNNGVILEPSPLAPLIQ